MRTRVLLRGVSAPRDASLSNLQRCLHASTHGSADCAPGNQPPNIGHSLKVVSFKRKPASQRPMWFAWDKALQMYSHSTGHFHIFLLQLSFFFFFFFLAWTAQPLGAHPRSLPTRRRAQLTTTPEPDSLQKTRSSSGRRRGTSGRTEKSGRCCASAQMCGGLTNDWYRCVRGRTSEEAPTLWLYAYIAVKNKYRSGIFSRRMVGFKERGKKWHERSIQILGYQDIGT